MVYICAWPAPPLAAGPMDLLQHSGPRAQPQARTAIRLRDQHREEPGFGQRGDERGGIRALAVQGAPVGAREPGAEFAHRVPDFGKGLVGVVGHKILLAPPL